MRKNARQAYGVAKWAGHQSSAESWGTGRAVARIPRVPGGGTHRAGQGAFGNMCRGGRMFSPLRVWRRWHRKVLKGQKRYAVASALAASAVPALVMARGHQISNIPEIPLVVANEAVEGLAKTKKAQALIKKIHADDDILKVKNTLVHRNGKGKYRNRPYKERVGPLLIHGSTTSNIAPAFRNLPGLEIVSVHKLNLLRLAPGGHLGRFVIWTRSAFDQLDKVWGTLKTASVTKKGYKLPRTILANSDVHRIIRSDEIQSVIRPKKTIVKRRKYVNPLTNKTRLAKLNPYQPIFAQVEKARAESAHAKRLKATEARKTAKPSTGKPQTGKSYLKKKRTSAFVKLLTAQ